MSDALPVGQNTQPAADNRLIRHFRQILLWPLQLEVSFKFGYLLVAMLFTSVLTLFTVAKSKPLSDFLEALSEGRMGTSAAFASLRRLWRSRED